MSNNESNTHNPIQNNQNSDQYGKKYNNIQSSLKYFNFEGMDKDKIIEKYEEVVCQREKQIRELAYEIGVINEKLENSFEKIKTLDEENRNINNKILKKNTLLEQELTNKDIMFIKLNNLQNENDKLMQKLQSIGIEYTSNDSSNFKKEKKPFWSGMFGTSSKVEEKKINNSNTQIPMVASKEKATDNSNLKNVSDTLENKEETNSIKKNQSSNANTNSNTGSNPRTHQANSTKSNNLSSSISALLTQDVLNSIDLQNSSMHKSNNMTPYSNNKTSSSSVNYNRNILKGGKNNTGNRNTMSGLDKRLASESIDYEPVFK